MAIRKENFNEIMQEKYGQKLKMDIARNYKYVIQEPLHEHRNEMARRFQNRIDYVNIKAYGIGKVDVSKKGLSRKMTQKVFTSDITRVVEDTQIGLDTQSDLAWEENEL